MRNGLRLVVIVEDGGSKEQETVELLGQGLA